MNSDDILGKNKIWKLCVTMAIPAILAQIVNLLYNIVDRMYIGNMDIGKDALGGLGLTLPIITLISAFSSFVGGGGAPLAARSLGAKDRKTAEKILGNGCTLLIFFSIVLSVLFLLIKKPVLYLIGASDVTFTYANDYLTIYLIGTIFVQLSVGLNSFITAQGKSKIAMFSVLIGALLNIVLDPLFIFVFNLGIKGAAIATIISQFASALFVLLVLCNKKASLRIKLSMMKIDFKIVLLILSVGVAPFVMAATESVIGFVLNRGLKEYGGDIYVSLLTILQSAMMLITVPVSGFTQGVTPIISYNYGAGNVKRLKQAFNITLGFCFSYCTLFALIMIIAPYPFTRMFTSEPELLSLSKTYLPIFVAGMLVFGIQRACQTTFVALGQAGISLFIALLRKIILLVPLAIILPHFFGVAGVYYSEPIADTTAALLCGLIFLIRFKKIIKKMESRNAIV